MHTTDGTNHHDSFQSIKYIYKEGDTQFIYTVNYTSQCIFYLFRIKNYMITT